MKKRRTLSFESARDALLVVLISGLLIWTGSVSLRALAAAPPRVNGPYTVTFAGDGSGKGKAIVTPKIVKIDATLVDEQGNNVVFSSKLDVDSSTYRFRGTASVGAGSATISGRIDADDKTLKKCRIVATYLTDDGKTGRIVGAKD